MHACVCVVWYVFVSDTPMFVVARWNDTMLLRLCEYPGTVLLLLVVLLVVRAKREARNGKSLTGMIISSSLIGSGKLGRVVSDGP
jgi:hypothetical protein